jgi:DNA-binding response OmpR family regulator
VTSVLVVDDDPDVCDLVTYKLEQSGFDVRRASDGDAALRKVAKKVPDLVLLDVMMRVSPALRCWSGGGPMRRPRGCR